jgi:dynactin-4
VFILIPVVRLFGLSAGSGLCLRPEQVQKIHAQTERVQSEFEALKDHLDSYITSTAPVQAKKPVPTRHISHLTQMAAKALHRDVPGMNAVSSRPKPKQDARDKWDDMGVYESKNRVKDVSEEVMEEDARDLERNGDRAALERVWCNSWSGSRAARYV